MDPSYHIRGRENSINVEKYLVESSQVYKLLLCVILCKLSNLKFKLGSLLDTEHRYLSERNMEDSTRTRTREVTSIVCQTRPC